jgi:hypothetical protein
MENVESGWKTPTWTTRVKEIDYAAFVLCLMYVALALIPSAFLLRLKIRHPASPLTIQKMFFVLVIAFACVRSLFFALIPWLWQPYPGEYFLLPTFHHTIFLFMDDIARLIYFSAYTVLILFWNQSIQAAQNNPQAHLVPAFLIGNSFIYTCQVVIWFLMLFLHNPNGSLDASLNKLSPTFFAFVALILAGLFILYGSRLYTKLVSHPIESRKKRKKARFVALVCIICTLCFAIRGLLMVFLIYIVKPVATDQWYSVFSYYLCTEFLPTALLLYALRRSPPPQYQYPTQAPLLGGPSTNAAPYLSASGLPYWSRQYDQSIWSGQGSAPSVSSSTAF